MVWRVEFSDQADKGLKRLDITTKNRIIYFLRERVATSVDPYKLAQPLAGPLAGLWRFRVGDYRIIADIQKAIVTIHVVTIAHRRHVYRD